VEKFESENNCKVVIDTFDSNETMYAKIRAGAAGYGLIVPSSYLVRLLTAQDLVLPLDHAEAAQSEEHRPCRAPPRSLTRR